MLDNIKQAWQHASHLFKAGHKMDAVTTFATELWRGRRVKTQKNVFIPPRLDDKGVSIQGEYKKSNLTISKTKKQIDETMRRVRAATSDETTPNLSHIKTQGRYEYIDVDAGPEQKLRFDKRIEIDDSEGATEVPSSEPDDKEELPTLYADALRILENEGEEAFEADLMTFPDIRDLVDFRERMIESNDYCLEMKVPWTRVANRKMADSIVENKLSHLLDHTFTKAELEEGLKELLNGDLFQETKKFVKNNFTGIAGTRPDRRADEQASRDFGYIMTDIGTNDVISQVKANIQDELDTIDITWQTMKESKTKANAELYDVTSVDSSVDEANRKWDAMPTKRNKNKNK